MAGAEPGWGCQDGVIDARHLQRLAESVEPAKTLFLRHTEILRSTLGLLGKQISYRDNFGVHAEVLARFEEVLPRATPASANTDDDSIDGLLALGTQHVRETGCGGRRGCCQGGGFNELPAANRRRWIGWILHELFPGLMF